MSMKKRFTHLKMKTFMVTSVMEISISDAYYMLLVGLLRMNLLYFRMTRVLLLMIFGVDYYLY